MSNKDDLFKPKPAQEPPSGIRGYTSHIADDMEKEDNEWAERAHREYRASQIGPQKPNNNEPSR